MTRQCAAVNGRGDLKWAHNWLGKWEEEDGLCSADDEVEADDGGDEQAWASRSCSGDWEWMR